MTLDEIQREHTELIRKKQQLKTEASELLGVGIIAISESNVFVDKQMESMVKISTVNSERGYFDHYAMLVDGVTVTYFSDYRSEP